MKNNLMIGTVLFGVLLYQAVANSQLEVLENFDTDYDGRWIPSANEQYTGRWQWAEATTLVGIEGDNGILLQDAARKSAIAYQLPTAAKAPSDKPFVFQYEVKLQESLHCGGAYVKLLSEEGSQRIEEFNSGTSYIIMFGPDKCGPNDRIHFIIKQQNPISKEWEEKHMMSQIKTQSNRRTNLYTLVIYPNNEFEIFVNLHSVKKGDLLKDFQPSFIPSKEIDDPDAVKPEDWIDVPKIPDPNAKKPANWDESQPAQIPDPKATKPHTWWDDEPETIPDPAAQPPDDWDEEEDGPWLPPQIPNPKCVPGGCGEWKPPMIPNPKFKGKWSAPLIPNPAYRGEWAPPKITNPYYFEDTTPAKNLPPIGAIGLELWTMQGSMLFDNFVISYDVEAALEYGKNTWKPKHDIETEKDPEKTEDQSGGFAEMLQGPTGIVILIVGVIICAIVCYLSFGGKTQQEDAEEEDEQEEQETQQEDEKETKSTNVRKRDTKKRAPKSE